MITEGALVEVTWEDAYATIVTERTAQEVSEMHEPALMRTVGYLVFDDKRGIMTSMTTFNSLQDEKLYNDFHFVPRGMVKKVRRVK